MLEDFILEHEGEDTAKLLLGRSKWPQIDMNKAVTAIECRAKIRSKLPTWHSLPSIDWPDRICSEQSSSEETARYKAALLSRIFGGRAFRTADITGGLGVDTAAFSKVSSQVWYNEMDERRAEAARHNFKILGVGNITVTSMEASLGVSAFCDMLSSFCPDVVYADPARRSKAGSKVFLIEDCSPDILGFIPEVFKYTELLLVKLSPMADISMVVTRLSSKGAVIREVHIVAAGGECKELLVLMGKGDGACSSEVALSKSMGQIPLYIKDGDSTVKVNYSDIKSRPSVMHLADESVLTPGMYLFEPGSALSKAGIFALIPSLLSGKSGLSVYEASANAHIYFMSSIPELMENSPLLAGKLFVIEDVYPLSKAGISALGMKYGNAGVTAMDVHMSSEELHRRLGCGSGGSIHVFGVRVDFAVGTANKLLVARRISL